MNADLEKTMAELGTDGRKTVGRLLASRQVAASRPLGIVRRPWWPVAVSSAALVAASLVAVLMTVVALRPEPGDVSVAASAPRNYSSREVYSLAYSAGNAEISEILRTQRADGSWANDFLTRQNAAALRDVAAARVAYLRAERYLRSRGLSALSDAELHSRSRKASQIRDGVRDA